MNINNLYRHITSSLKKKFTIIIFVSLASACSLHPSNVNLDLNANLPIVKTTIFNQAIRQLGKTNLIYDRGPLYVMSKPIFDNTGTALATKSEIPRDISEMVISVLNSFGGEIWYVPYDPEFMLNAVNTGYTTWGNKLLPNVVLVGGLTEFDRGLVTKEEGTDISGSAEEIGIPMGLDFDDTRKSSLARITLDFNLLDFNAFVGIPFMQAINSISVHKGMGKDQLGFTVYGQTLGLRGNIKKIQGRHAAVRLLVQASLIQIVGKYQKLPYWRLLPNAEPDPIVIDAIREEFYMLELPDRIAKIQEYLYLCGKKVEITGRIDAATHSAILGFKAEHEIKSHQIINEELFLALFENIPLDIQTQVRRKKVISLVETYQNDLRALAIQESEILPSMPVNTLKAKQETMELKLGKVKVWMDKEIVQIGEPITIFFEVTRPMFVRIVTINSVGKISTLFPSPYQDNNFVHPGKTYQIPSAESSVKLVVGEPAGVDKIRIVASTAPIPIDAFPLDEDGELPPNVGQKFAISGTEFEVLAKPDGE